MRRHPYILATLTAALLAIVVWLCIPKEYTAVVKLSDEYKETGLAIGYSNLKAHLKNLTGIGDNNGINDMALYCKLLKTDDFARSIAQKKIAQQEMTYGQYLGEEDTVKTIRDHINYNYSSKCETLSISFTDRNPVVAAQMLDSITVQLQQLITHYRHIVADSTLQSARLVLKESKEKYKEAQERYDLFADSHMNSNTQEVRQQERTLEKELKTAYGHYASATEQYVRQEALKRRSYLSFSVIHNNSVPLQSNASLIGYILGFVTLALLGTHGFLRFRRKSCKEWLQTIDLHQLHDYFSPWMLTIGIWATILGLYYAIDTDLYPIEEQFYFCFALWVPIFCVCALAACLLGTESRQTAVMTGGIDYNKAVFNLFFVISMIITPMYVYRVYQIVIMFGTDDILNNVRMLAVHGEGQGFLNYSHVLNQALFVVALWSHPKVPMWQVVLLGFACLLNSLAIMEKGTILFIVLSIAFVLFEKKVIRIRTIVIVGLVLILFFYFFNLMRAEEDSDYQKEETLLDFFAMYALSPPVAFCQLMPEVTPQFGTNTFAPIYVLLERFGVNGLVIKEKTQEFVFVPIGTNVYTIFQPFFIDFGYKGIAFFAALYGCVSGWLYRLFRNKQGTGTCLYAYTVYVLVMQFYQENIFNSLVFVLQFAFFVLLFTQQKIKFST